MSFPVLSVQRYHPRRQQRNQRNMFRQNGNLAVFGGQQRQQWLVCWAVAELKLVPMIAPYSFHAHGCYPFPPGVELRNGALMADDVEVLFRHHV